MSSSGPLSALLASPKNAANTGTCESDDVAFQLFLGFKPEIFGSYGFHCIPHVGCYTHSEYTPALPIGLISMPVFDETTQFPASVRDVLAKCRGLDLLRGDVECYVVVHAGHEHRPCQHFMCDNIDEFNLILHAWVFAEDGVSETEEAMNAQLLVGIFEAHGVRPVHQELARLGTAFDALTSMECLIHDRRFSPDNCNVRLDESVTDVPVFFSVALDRTLKRAVVTLHCLPVGDGPSDRVRDWMRGLCTLGDLRGALAKNLPVAGAHFERLLLGGTGKKEEGGGAIILSSSSSSSSNSAAPSS